MNALKFLLALGTLFLYYISSAQSISVKQEDSNQLTFLTEPIEITIPCKSVAAGNYLAPALCLIVKKKSNIEQFRLDFTLDPSYIFTFDKGSHLYIQTTTGNIITLENRIGLEDVIYTYNFFKGSQVTPQYLIPYKELQLIINEGIAALRFESTSGLLDFYSTQNTVGRAIKAEYDLIRKTIGFDSDF